MLVDRLPIAVKGRPLLLGNDLDLKVQAYIASLCEAGGVVNTAIVIVAHTGSRHKISNHAYVIVIIHTRIQPTTTINYISLPSE